MGQGQPGHRAGRKIGGNNYLHIFHCLIPPGRRLCNVPQSLQPTSHQLRDSASHRGQSSLNMASVFVTFSFHFQLEVLVFFCLLFFFPTFFLINRDCHSYRGNWTTCWWIQSRWELSWLMQQLLIRPVDLWVDESPHYILWAFKCSQSIVFHMEALVI